jgi:hypothetical protein
VAANVGRAEEGRFHIVCIVEGEGELKAVPTLVERSVKLLQLELAVQVSPVHESRGAFQKQHEVEKIIRAALIRLRRPGGILILFDSDGTVPACWALEFSVGRAAPRRVHRLAL